VGNEATYLDDTGEFILPGGEIVKAGERKKTTAPQWFKGIRAGFRTLAKFRLKETEINAFLWLAGSIRYGSQVVVNQSAMSSELGMEKAAVSRAIKTLVLHNIITPDGRVGQLIRYRINSAYCWTGSSRASHDDEK